MKKKIFIISVIICFVVFSFSIYKVLDYYIKEQNAAEEFSQLAEEINETDTDSLLKKYKKLAKQNKDMIGWIFIEDTKINYPVMYTPDAPNYYLKHSFEKEYSDYGVPYVAEHCNPTKPSDNVLIYGHHMKNGTMFAGLMDYTDESFYKKHPVICFDTLNQRGKYEIIAVLTTTVKGNESFQYNLFTDAQEATDFNAYVNTCKERSLYNIEATAKYGDKLITLSTCEDSAASRRIAVVAKKI